jgi:hypothetical protein
MRFAVTVTPALLHASVLSATVAALADDFSCHWAIVLGENATDAERALAQLDPHTTAHFAFDHMLLGEYWKDGLYHFPGQAEGGLSGLFMDECPYPRYSNLSNASYHRWEETYDRCMSQHLATLPELFDRFGTAWTGRGAIPTDWDGLVVWDLEAWNPSWQDSTWSLNAE